jgi:hypothetical protein
LEDLQKQVNALEVIVNKLAEQNEQVIHQAYTFYLHINSLTKQLIEKETLDKNQLALDMEELNELNAKLHKFSEPQPGTASEATAEVEA